MPRRPGAGRGARERPALDLKAARLAAFELLARKAWSARELGRRLRRRGAPAEVAQAVVAELGERRYLDDEAFARWWAEARARGRRLGPVRLRQELRARGIPPAVAEAAVAAAAEAAPEAARALEAARRRLPALLRSGADRAPARLRDYLLRRGYPRAVAVRTVRALLGRRGGAGTEAEDAEV